jgi:SPP1 gp7 family putative phage head morphogenesis protein
VHAFLQRQAPRLAHQIAVRRSLLGKAELSQDELDALDRIVASLDFSGWGVLVGEVEPILRDLVSDSAYAAMAHVGIDTEARSEVANVVNAHAVDYAETRAADMVGMRRDAAGNLVPNPNAEWQITEGTRDGIRADVRDAIAEGWTNKELADKLVDSYAFSAERAMVIARTETNRASNAGALNGYRESGVVGQKQWLTAEDDRVSEECEANGSAGENQDGVIDLNDDFPSGDEAPPVHPNCRCAIAPVITEAAGTPEATDTEQEETQAEGEAQVEEHEARADAAVSDEAEA